MLGVDQTQSYSFGPRGVLASHGLNCKEQTRARNAETKYM